MSVAYSILMIDPPWPLKKSNYRKVRPEQGKALDYETMAVPEIFQLLDRDILPGLLCHAVFMWCVDRFLLDCEAEMLQRGYKRHCRFIWNKGNGIAPAFTVRFSHEYLIWYYKPRLPPISKLTKGLFKTVFTEKPRQHSRKPDFAYQMIEQLYPDFPKTDVFSRELRTVWHQYGNQLDHFKKTST